MAILGFKPSDYDTPIGLWPENIAPLQLLRAMDDQWTLSPRGLYVGPRLEVLELVASHEGIQLDDATWSLFRHAARSARAHLNS